MNTRLRLQRSLIILGVPLLLMGLMQILAKSTFFATYPRDLSLGITVDLVVIIPAVYMLLIWKTAIPKTTVIPVLLAGMAVGFWILPTEHEGYLELVKAWLLPVIELVVLTLVGFKLKKAIRVQRLNKTTSSDFFSTLKSTCVELLPGALVMPLATEVAVFYYGFFKWKKRPLRENEFSYYRESGTIALLAVIILVIGAETVALHLLFARWSLIAAWILSGLSLYSGLQLFGFLKSMYYRPFVLEDNRLCLRYGIMCETMIDLKDIEAVVISSKEIETAGETRKLSFLGPLESHNMILRLRRENEWVGLYGMKRNYRSLAIFVDEKEAFKQKLEAAMESLPAACE